MQENQKKTGSKPTGKGSKAPYGKTGNAGTKTTSKTFAKSGIKSSSKPYQKSASKQKNTKTASVKTAPTQKKQEKKPMIPKLPEGWILFSHRNLTASDIRNIFPDDRDVDVWNAAGVVEIVLGEKLTMDIEQVEIPAEPDEDAAWYAQQGILSQFYITFDKEGYQEAMADMKHIVKELGVQICADTDDLTPVIE